MKATKTYGASFDATIAVSNLSAGVLRSFSSDTPESVVRYLLPEARSVARSSSTGVVYVGRLTRSKGVVPLARATRKAQVAVTFVGEGEARDEVVAENPDAVVTGWVTPKATEAHILGATALVLPSLWYETFGLVVAEALALGRPVVVSDRAGAKELVQDGINGLIWRADCEDHLVECLRKVARASYAEALSERVPELYRESWVSPEKHAAQLIEVYQRAWSARGQQSESICR
jgi:glycosyltransferase involved in cell wall biosynthesis